MEELLQQLDVEVRGELRELHNAGQGLHLFLRIALNADVGEPLKKCFIVRHEGVQGGLSAHPSSSAEWPQHYLDVEILHLDERFELGLSFRRVTDVVYN